MPLPDVLVERRKFFRHRALKGAQIGFRGRTATIDCVVRDFTDRGARLSVATPIGIPDDFELSRAGLPVRKCRVVWRKAAMIGVEFF